MKKLYVLLLAAMMTVFMSCVAFAGTITFDDENMKQQVTIDTTGAVSVDLKFDYTDYGGGGIGWDSIREGGWTQVSYSNEGALEMTIDTADLRYNKIFVQCWWVGEPFTVTYTLNMPVEFEITDGVLTKYVGKGGEVVIPDGVTSIGERAFYANHDITKVTIPSSVTSIGSNAFMYCSSLAKVEIPNGVKTIGFSAFDTCAKLTDIKIPASVTQINGNPFMGCGALTSISVDKGNQNYDSRSNCNAIINKKTNELITACDNTTIPSDIKAIGQYAFDGCHKIKNVVIPNGVTSVGEGAFYGCAGMTSLVIPKSVTSLGAWMLEGCMALKDVYYEGTKAAFDKIKGNFDMATNDMATPHFTMHYETTEQPLVNPFTDVPSGKWYATPILYVLKRGIMTGTTATTFAPEAKLTRGQVVVMLWNLEGQPKVTTSGSFKDVEATKYYAKAVEWAKANGVVSGNADGTFAPAKNITRQEFMAIIKNYASYKKISTKVVDKEAYKACSDYKDVSKFAISTIQWSYENGLIGANGKLTPKENISRAEAASVMQRFLTKYKL